MGINDIQDRKQAVATEMIRVENLVKIYRTDTIQTTALDHISLKVDKEEFIAVMGPSGCGKSTLVHILGMLDSATSGDYFFLGENVSECQETRLSAIRKRHIGFIFQNFHLIEELTVSENIDLPLLYRKVSTAERRERVDAVMDKVGISHRSKHMPNQLSGGQQQRVAIARALVTEPDLIVADEPTGNLDSEHGDEVLKMLRNLNSEGTTIIMVTHSQTHAQYAKRIVNLFDGRIVPEVTP